MGEIVFRSDRKECLRRGLVLDAVGIGYEIRRESEEHSVVVASSDAARARMEIEAYAEENRGGRERPVATPSEHGNGWAGVVGFVVVLSVGFALQETGAISSDWFDAGMTQAGAIRAGQLWRAVTALTLHSDLAHLAANIVAGGLIGVFAGQLLGSGLAWMSILLAGAAGNLLNAWVRDAGHTSIGASTAVFGALGIIAAHAWVRPARMRHSALARVAPIVGGVVLLSYLGTSGERTDVLAHVAGFVAGLALGAIYGKLGGRVSFGVRGQIVCGVGAVLVLALAWVAAIA